MDETAKISSKILESLAKNDALQRKHANFWNFYKKTSKELGLFSEIFERFQLEVGQTIVSWGLCQPDPPDIYTKFENGVSHGIEITELVNEQAIKAQINNPENYYQELIRFDFEKSVVKLKEILLEKEQKLSNISNEYNELSLLIHTDEPLLKSDQFIGKGHEIFPSGSNVFQKVYLLFSYDPFKKNCPLVRLI